MSPSPNAQQSLAQRWQRLSSALLRAFHRYASWLVSITWRRFILLAIGLMIAANIVASLPPFSWSVTETIEDATGRASTKKPPKPPKAPKAPGPSQESVEPTSPEPPAPPEPPASGAHPREPIIKIERPASGAGKVEGIDISIDERGIRITPKATRATQAASAASATAEPGLHIKLPADVDKAAIREAVQEARAAIEEAIQAQRDAAEVAREAREAAREAEQEARAAAREAADEAASAFGSPAAKIKRIRRIRWADFLTDLALMWIIASAIVKATYKGRMQAEVKAAQATETAEAESLKRQVIEARMAAMQAQVEPHFLFNTLASIDHLIETDPPRASQMQKNLIALLRASMPTMREATSDGSNGGVRDLARELQVIRPYLEILKVRMEERLSTRIEVPDGLLSAEFPPMMVQTLVENAIKHGLEPKAEGGQLTVRAEIVHGKLQVSVADTGLGFGRAATAGTGVGLANIRERLQLLYGPKAALTVAENPGGGTLVTITVPYRSLEA
jgi:signal transduction histidine kinase